MVSDSNIYHVVDAITHEKMMSVLRLSLEMAKESYPHLVDKIQQAINRAKENTETFIGTHNKPNTHKAYETKK